MRLLDGIHHIAFITSDMDRLISFYERIFEARVTLDLEDEDLRHVFIEVGPNTLLHPFEVPGIEPRANNHCSTAAASTISPSTLPARRSSASYAVGSSPKGQAMAPLPTWDRCLLSASPIPMGAGTKWSGPSRACLAGRPRSWSTGKRSRWTERTSPGTDPRVRGCICQVEREARELF